MPVFEPIPAKAELVANQTIGAAIEVHRDVGSRIS